MRGGLILAGGKSTRMGRNKAFLQVGGKAIITRVAEAVLRMADEVVVVIGRDDRLPPYASALPRDVKVVRDRMKSTSPLVGIASGLKDVEATYSAVLSCDLPFVSERVMAMLFMEAEGCDAAIPVRPNRRLEPLHAVYRSLPALQAAEEALKAGELSNLDMIKRLEKVNLVSARRVRELDRRLLTLFNLNSPRDYEFAVKAERAIKRL